VAIKQDNVVSYGLDYLRFKVGNQQNADFVQSMYNYVDIPMRWFHGTLCADFTGDVLEVIRMIEGLHDLPISLSWLYTCSRIDVFIDVMGNIIDEARHPGTCIMNDGVIETVYSQKLTSRGNVPTFARMYDAQSAGHYGLPVTRFECEYKLQKAGALLHNGEWLRNPIEVALYDIEAIYGISIHIDGLTGVEFYAKKTPIQENRERFYARYGRGIMRDIEKYGVQGLYSIIMSTMRTTRGETDNGTEIA